VSFVHTITPTFPASSFVIHPDVFGHQLCYQIDGKEGAYLSVFPSPSLRCRPLLTLVTRH